MNQPGDEAAPIAPQPYRWAMLGGLWLIYFGFGLTVDEIYTLGLVAIMGRVVAAARIRLASARAPSTTS